LNVIISAGTPGVALTLGVPRQAHWIGYFDLRLGESRQSPLRNLVPQSLGLDRAHFIAAKQ